MAKDEIKIKSNGLRNELKEIRKSIDKLTNALIEIHLAQTNKHHETDIINDCCDDDAECECKRIIQ
ncbi:MAG: hypothetical protein Unbinned6046contig1000_48 [Prokaryotic dsDNA virus sp.]|nr:MAG: hypothetical protein Unbinned6046contig1000_48 [Prokaryotic dsDNA virus sp.]|tara:strand:+ start:91 stop:288 length:198 start_codon:yes stop_codon:yes gene_type:complete